MAAIGASLILYSIFIFFGVIFAFLKPKRTIRRGDTVSLPPGPKPWPFFGCALLLWRKPVFRWIHELMAEQNLGIMCIKFGKTHVIPVTSCAIAREFLKRQNAIFSSRPFCMSADVTSRGYLSTIFSPMGEQWKKMRRILSSHILSPATHRWLQDKRDKEADHLIRFVYNHCKSFSAGGLVNVRVTAQHFCGNVIRQMIFSKRFFGSGTQNGGPGLEEVEHVGAVFTMLSHLYAFCISDYFPFLRGFVDLDGHEKIIRKAVASAAKYHDPEIDQRIQLWKDGRKSEPEDLLDIFITLRDADGRSLLTAEEIKAEITELMVATVDNPSNAVEWALAEMLNQPQVLERATAEIDRVVGKERLVQESDLPQLNYVKACLRESFRLHPIAPFNVPHVSSTDTTVAGFFIPKGSHVILSRPGLGRDPNEWDEPLTYRPERHIKEDGAQVVLTDFDLRMMSFSTGRRGCPGVHLGSTITTMLMARLLQGFTWNLPPDVSKIELKESAHDLLLHKPLIALAKSRLNQEIYV